MAKKPRGFEQSRFDNDTGVKETSPADKARDKKELPKFKAARKNKRGGRGR